MESEIEKAIQIIQGLSPEELGNSLVHLINYDTNHEITRPFSFRSTDYHGGPFESITPDPNLVFNNASDQIKLKFASAIAKNIGEIGISTQSKFIKPFLHPANSEPNMPCNWPERIYASIVQRLVNIYSSKQLRGVKVWLQGTSEKHYEKADCEDDVLQATIDVLFETTYLEKAKENNERNNIVVYYAPLNVLPLDFWKNNLSEHKIKIYSRFVFERKDTNLDWFVNNGFTTSDYKEFITDINVMINLTRFKKIYLPLLEKDCETISDNQTRTDVLNFLHKYTQ